MIYQYFFNLHDCTFKADLKIWQILTETPVLESHFNEAASPQVWNFIKKRLQLSRFSVKS